MENSKDLNSNSVFLSEVLLNKNMRHDDDDGSLPESISSNYDKKSISLPLRNYLLFTGVERPPTWRSPWWIAWVGWRIVAVLSFVVTIQNMIGYHNQQQWLFNYYLLPSLFATFAAASSWSWLTNVLRDIEAQGGPEIIEEDMTFAKNIFNFFVFSNFFLSFIISCFKSSRADSTIKSVALFGTIFLECCGATVVLGGVLLVLTIETTLAKKEVREVMQAARDQTLTRSFYADAVKSIRLRSLRWQWPLNSLVFVACYCAVCLIILQLFMYGSEGHLQHEIFRKQDDDDVSSILIDIEMFITLLKEVFLFFIIAYLIMGINDEADAITAELLSHTWGQIGSPHDCARLDLLFMSKVVAAPLDAVKSWYSFLSVHRKRPISFFILSLRFTRKYVLAALFSYLFAMSNVLYRVVLVVKAASSS
jgi:hypothetical protein